MTWGSMRALQKVRNHVGGFLTRRMPLFFTAGSSKQGSYFEGLEWWCFCFVVRPPSSFGWTFVADDSDDFPSLDNLVGKHACFVAVPSFRIRCRGSAVVCGSLDATSVRHSTALSR